MFCHENISEILSPDWEIVLIRWTRRNERPLSGPMNYRPFDIINSCRILEYMNGLMA